MAAYPSAATNRQWAEWVVESLGVERERLGEWCRERDIPFDHLERLRALFIDAGMLAVAETESWPRWVQADVPLDPGDGGIVLLEHDLAGHVDGWRSSGLARHFSFVHKPPGIRLRFGGVGREFTEHLRAWLRMSAGSRWSWGCYAPEVFQFGGGHGAELAHEFFTLESLAVLRFRECQWRGLARRDAMQFSLVLLDRCFRALVEDQWELWDVWCGQFLTGRLDIGEIAVQAIPAAELERLRQELLPLFEDAECLATGMSQQEAALWQAYEAGLSTLLPRCIAARDQGKLLWSLRQILPFWAIFHWNRMAFDERQQRRLALLMTQVLCPKW